MENRTQLLHIVNAKIKRPVCAEIGVFRGGYSRQIYDILHPSEFWLVDPWKRPPGFDDYSHMNDDHWENAYQGVLKKVGFEPGVKVCRKISMEACHDFEDKYFDFIYVDADHSYEHVKADLTAWLPKVKPGGFIAGHDIDQEGVYQAAFEVLSGLKWMITSKQALKSYLAIVE